MSVNTKKRTETPATARLSVVIAREARTAIVFRRGPSKQVRMIVWDLATDTFVKGQWLSGRVSSCDVSPDGKLLVYFASKHGTKLGTFTAISQPPYFTALALWPDGESWGGGGRFVSNKKVVLGYNSNPKELNEGNTIPEDFQVSDGFREQKMGSVPPPSPWMQISVRSDKQHETESMRHVFDEPSVCERHNPRDHRLVLERRYIGRGEINGRYSVDHYRLLEFGKSGDRDPKIEDLGDPDWADWDHDGSLLLSRDGCLFRRSTPRSQRNQELVQIADFRDDVFKNVLPTDEAKRWPGQHSTLATLSYQQVLSLREVEEYQRRMAKAVERLRCAGLAAELCGKGNKKFVSCKANNQVAELTEPKPGTVLVEFLDIDQGHIESRTFPGHRSAVQAVIDWWERERG